MSCATVAQRHSDHRNPAVPALNLVCTCASWFEPDSELDAVSRVCFIRTTVPAAKAVGGIWTWYSGGTTIERR